jgi:hypothetical protein
MWEKIKNAWKSWTIWFNSSVAGVSLALPMLQDSFPQLQPYIPVDTFKYVMAALIIGNIFLRFKTTTSLAQK